MGTLNVDVKKVNCDNKLRNPQALMQHLKAIGDIYHKTAYEMLNQIMTGFHAPTVDHYGQKLLNMQSGRIDQFSNRTAPA